MHFMKLMHNREYIKHLSCGFFCFVPVNSSICALGNLLICTKSFEDCTFFERTKIRLQIGTWPSIFFIDRQISRGSKGPATQHYPKQFSQSARSSFTLLTKITITPSNKPVIYYYRYRRHQKKCFGLLFLVD